MSTILRPFGRTGLMVSPVTLGTMEFGSKVDDAEAGKLFAQALDAGVNVFDTANVYAGGRSEEILGQLIGSMRDRLILGTKFAVPTDSLDPNSGGAGCVAPHGDRRLRGQPTSTRHRLHRPVLHPSTVHPDRDR